MHDLIIVGAGTAGCVLADLGRGLDGGGRSVAITATLWRTAVDAGWPW